MSLDSKQPHSGRDCEGAAIRLNLVPWNKDRRARGATFLFRSYTMPGMSNAQSIEVYEWKKGAPRPSLMGSEGILACLEAPPTGGQNVGDTILLPGVVVGDRSSLGVPYRVLERIRTAQGGPRSYSLVRARRGSHQPLSSRAVHPESAG
jgi:hypothetical protein